ncbi:MAG: acyltransferase domain-containing protein [Gammaproteobacteria bacterium]
MKPIVFMFSGQGSHYDRMGIELYEQQPVFRHWLQRMDDTARELVGESVAESLYAPGRKRGAPGAGSAVSSLAIVMVEYALAQVLLDMGIKPDYLLGCSLGEVTGTMLAEADDWPAALKSIVERMQLYEQYCASGGMIGILAPPAVYETMPELYLYSELAGVNFDTHFIVSCRSEYIRPIKNHLCAAGIAFQTLDVSQAFHSSLLDPAEPSLRAIFAEKRYRAPKIPLLSCATARPVTAIDSGYFWNVIRKPILFQQTVRALENRGTYRYVDLGPSGTLANFVKYNLAADSRSEYYAVMTPFGGELKRLQQLQRSFEEQAACF